jgi:hypothetical protein
MPTGMVMFPRTSLTVPCHRNSVRFSIGSVIATRLEPSARASGLTKRPPHSPLSCPRSMMVELTTVGSPSSGTTRVNGVATASSHVSTCVNPRSEDIPMGIRNAPSMTARAARERKIDGTLTVSGAGTGKSKPSPGIGGSDDKMSR